MLDSEEHGISVYSGSGCSSKGQGYIKFSFDAVLIEHLNHLGLAFITTLATDIESLYKLAELEEFKLFLLEPTVLGRGLEARTTV